MVKKILCIAVCGAMLVANGEQYTTVVQVLNMPLTVDALNLINESDVSTPDRVFLAFLKSCCQGQLNSFLSLFTDGFLKSEFGVQNKDDFTSGDALDFQGFFNDSAVTNKTLVSYNCVISGNVAHVTSTLNLVTRNRSVNEEFDMDIVQTNGVWKINQW